MCTNKSLVWSWIPDCSEGRYTSACHAVYYLFRELPVRYNRHGFRIEFLDQTICQFHHIRFLMFTRICRVSYQFSNPCPCFEYLLPYNTASGDFSRIESTKLSPKVSRTFGDVHKSLIGTLCSNITGAQGPMPEPVATTTRRRKRGTIRSTPKVGTPRIHKCVGGLSICFAVQSPARLTTSE